MTAPQRECSSGASTTATAPALSLRRLGGQGPDMLLLHGFGSDSLSWVVNQTALEAAGTVFAVDLPGHGLSGSDVGDGHVGSLAALVADAIDRNGLKRLNLVGHSLGGGVAMALAQARPDLVAALVLIAPAGLGRAVDPAFLTAYPDLDTAGDAELLLRRLVQQPRRIGRPLVARVLEQLRRPGARAALQTVAEGLVRSTAALEHAAGSVAASSLPRLVIWGAHDAINPLSTERLQAFGGRAFVAPEVGHLPHIEAPRLVNIEIIRFLQEVNGDESRA